MKNPDVFTDPDTNQDTLASLLGTNRTYVYDALRECADQTPADLNISRINTKSQIKSVYLQRLKDKSTTMAREERNMLGFVVALISEFANHFGIRPRQAYAYLKRYKGMEHLHDHYGVLHTQSFPDVIEALAQVCVNNGGALR